MEEIKVGEYVRTKEDGYIGKKVKDGLRKGTIEIENNICSWLINIYNIKKHSENLIDLIEEGDYVNGEKVLQKTKIKDGSMQICILKDNNSSNWKTINNFTLKNIVTKEMFNQRKYEV